MSMNLRHAAALALVGWYLMVPPGKSNSGVEPDLQWPLAQWSSLQSFDAAADCERAKKELQLKYMSLSSAHRVTVFEMATCVEADDPRLKPN
jgi:hypothetical protein